MYAIRFFAKEKLNSKNEIIINEKKSFFVVDSEWVEATSSIEFENKIPKDIKIFNSKKSAKTFMKNWKYHPWYAEPRHWDLVKLKIDYVKSYYEKTLFFKDDEGE